MSSFQYPIPYFSTLTFVDRNLCLSQVPHATSTLAQDTLCGTRLDIASGASSVALTILEKLGEGSWGEIYRAQRKSDYDQQIVALKFGDASLIVKEAQILKKLGDQNRFDQQPIAKILSEVFTISINHQERAFFLQTICQETLLQYYQKYQFGLSLNKIYRISLQLLQGLEFLHNEKIIHGDLKPENIMFESSPYNPVFKLRIIDFGNSQESPQQNADQDDEVTTLYYRSPELLFGLPYDTSVDLWSLACILVELYTSRPLLEAESEATLVGMIADLIGGPSRGLLSKISTVESLKKASLFPSLNRSLEPYKFLNFSRMHQEDSLSEKETFTNFIYAILKWTSEERPSFDEISRHQFIENAKKI